MQSEQQQQQQRQLHLFALASSTVGLCTQQWEGKKWYEVSGSVWLRNALEIYTKEININEFIFKVI